MPGIRLATTDADIASALAVMRELRPHLKEDEAAFVATIRRQQRSGYHLALLESAGEVEALAGFRIGENLAWGRFLYVDDLVTRATRRSRGHGARLLAWLKARAKEEGCAQLRLDSGAQRHGAHRFYEREGMQRSGFHFAVRLGAEGW